MRAHTADPQEFAGLCNRIVAAFPDEAAGLTPEALIEAGWTQTRDVVAAAGGRQSRVGNRLYKPPGYSTWLKHSPKVLAMLCSLTADERQQLLGLGGQVDAKHAAPSSSQAHIDKDAATRTSSGAASIKQHEAHAQQKQEHEARDTAAGMQAGTPKQQAVGGGTGTRSDKAENKASSSSDTAKQILVRRSALGEQSRLEQLASILQQPAPAGIGATGTTGSKLLAQGIRLYQERDTKRGESYLLWEPHLPMPQPMRTMRHMADVILRVGRDCLMQDVQAAAPSSKLAAKDKQDGGVRVTAKKRGGDSTVPGADGITSDSPKAKKIKTATCTPAPNTLTQDASAGGHATVQPTKMPSPDWQAVDSQDAADIAMSSQPFTAPVVEQQYADFQVTSAADMTAPQPSNAPSTEQQDADFQGVLQLLHKHQAATTALEEMSAELLRQLQPLMAELEGCQTALGHALQADPSGTSEDVAWAAGEAADTRAWIQGVVDGSCMTLAELRSLHDHEGMSTRCTQLEVQMEQLATANKQLTRASKQLAASNAQLILDNEQLRSAMG